MTREEIAERFPQAVEFARLMRDTFGDGVRLTYARNASGEELGRLIDAPQKMAKIPLDSM